MQPYDPSEFIGLVQSAFSSEGVLARNTSHFQPRLGQTDMAMAVAHILQDGRMRLAGVNCKSDTVSLVALSYKKVKHGYSSETSNSLS